MSQLYDNFTCSEMSPSLIDQALFKAEFLIPLQYHIQLVYSLHFFIKQ